MGCKIEINKIYALFVVIMFLCAVTPLVLADNPTTVTITFTPEGELDVDVSPDTYGFGDIGPGNFTVSAADAFTLYNNGSVNTDTEIRAGNSADMTLQNTGSPGSDQFSIQVIGLSVASPAWITNADVTRDEDLGVGLSQTFGMNLTIGNVTAAHGQQSFTMTFTGSAHT